MKELSVGQILNLMTMAFQHGYALDLIDITGERNKDISEEQRFCYDAAEAAFSRVDTEALYVNAKGLGIPQKYPEFYDYLSDLVVDLEEDFERVPEVSAEMTKVPDVEEIEELIEEPTSIKDKVLWSIVNGNHTGNERDSEKYVEKDEIRKKLTEEYHRMMRGEQASPSLGQKSTGVYDDHQDKTTYYGATGHETDPNEMFNSRARELEEQRAAEAMEFLNGDNDRKPDGSTRTNREETRFWHDSTSKPMDGSKSTQNVPFGRDGFGRDGKYGDTQRNHTNIHSPVDHSPVNRMRELDGQRAAEVMEFLNGDNDRKPDGSTRTDRNNTRFWHDPETGVPSNVIHSTDITSSNSRPDRKNIKNHDAASSDQMEPNPDLGYNRRESIFQSRKRHEQDRTEHGRHPESDSNAPYTNAPYTPYAPQNAQESRNDSNMAGTTRNHEVSDIHDPIYSRGRHDSYYDSSYTNRDADATNLKDQTSSTSGHTSHSQGVTHTTDETDQAWRDAERQAKDRYQLDSYAQVSYAGVRWDQSENKEYVDILAEGRRNGNTVVTNIDGRSKQYTVSSNGTISVDNQQMKVFGTSGTVSVGWKGAVKNELGQITTPTGETIDLEHSRLKVTVSKGTAPAPEPFHNMSMLNKNRVNEKDFVLNDNGEKGKIFVAANTNQGMDDHIKRTHSLMEQKSFYELSLRQGLYGQKSFMEFNANEISGSQFFSEERVAYLADSYESLISGTCIYSEAARQADEMASGWLKDQNLPTDLEALDLEMEKQSKHLSQLRAEVKQSGLPTDIKKLEQHLAKGATAEQLRIARQYIDESERVIKTQESVKKYRYLVSRATLNAEEALKLNALMENQYLDAETKKELKELRELLQEQNLPSDIRKLKEQLLQGKLSSKQEETARRYLALTLKTRKKIIRNHIIRFDPDSKLYGSEQKLYKQAIGMILEKEGLPKHRENLAEMLNNGKFEKEQERVAREAMRLLNLRALAEAARKTAAAMAISLKKAARLAKSGFRFIKRFMNRNMHDDYTLRGAMILMAVAVAPVKAVQIAKRGIRMAKLAANVVINTGKAVKAGALLARSGIRAIPGLPGRVARGTRSGLRWAKITKNKIRILGPKKTAKKVAQKSGHAVVKAVKGILNVVVKILASIVSTLGAILLPILIVIIIVLGIVFCVMAFIKNTGEEVYYDAGDEDTEAVVQEMVDVLTLCHASFRDSLTNQFGGGVSTSATGTTSSDGISVPQLKKGESSAVKGLYDVTAGTWWNHEFTQSGYLNTYTMAAGTKQRAVQDKLKSGSLSVRDNGGLMFIDEKYYAAAFTSYWGNVGDVLKVEFENPMAIGNQPATNTINILIVDIKAFKDTHYPEQKDGLYGHQLGNHRDFAEFIGSTGANLNGSALGCPVKATNMGSILDGTCDLGTIGTGGSGSSSVNADVYYRQVIDQETYREIIDREKNIYYTFPDEQDAPDGITPEPSPSRDEEGEIYGFYNNNQELISMVLALFDFDINDSTSVKKTLVLTSDTASESDESASQIKGVTDKIDDDTWNLITLFDEYGLDFTSTGYKEGGYDDLKYSVLVGLFNASHIVCGTPVYTYHAGPDGTINPVYKNGKIVGQNNTDGQSYEVPVMTTYTRSVEDAEGNMSIEYYTDYQIDADGEIVYETHYCPCPGHLKYSADVITLHFDALLNLNKWWKTNIYNVDDFDKENPSYSSNDPDDVNYKAKETSLKRRFQYIKKPDYYKAASGTCSNSAGSSGFSPGTMSESEIQVAKKCYAYMTSTMALTSEQAYGVLVNIKRESDFRYTATENSDGSGGYGLCQWTGGRRSQLISWCNAHPGSGAYNTLEGQLAYLNAEFNSLSSVWTGNGVAGFRQCTTAREAGEYFLRYFERPAAEHVTQRIEWMDGDVATVKGYVGG